MDGDDDLVAGLSQMGLLPPNPLYFQQQRAKVDEVLARFESGASLRHDDEYPVHYGAVDQARRRARGVSSSSRGSRPGGTGYGGDAGETVGGDDNEDDDEDGDEDEDEDDEAKRSDVSDEDDDEDDDYEWYRDKYLWPEGSDAPRGTFLNSLEHRIRALGEWLPRVQDWHERLGDRLPPTIVPKMDLEKRELAKIAHEVRVKESVPSRYKFLMERVDDTVGQYRRRYEKAVDDYIRPNVEEVVNSLPRVRREDEAEKLLDAKLGDLEDAVRATGGYGVRSLLRLYKESHVIITDTIRLMQRQELTPDEQGQLRAADVVRSDFGRRALELESDIQAQLVPIVE